MKKFDNKKPLDFTQMRRNAMKASPVQATVLGVPVEGLLPPQKEEESQEAEIVEDCFEETPESAE